MGQNLQLLQNLYTGIKNVEVCEKDEAFKAILFYYRKFLHLHL